MISAALRELQQSLEEVSDLSALAKGLRPDRTVHVKRTRAVCRSSVLLIYSHFEKYIYTINSESFDAICQFCTSYDRLPLMIRLHHSRRPIDSLASTSWEHRQKKLEELFSTESGLWRSGHEPQLVADRVLEWMTSVDVKSLERYYAMWGIDRIFNRITRAQHNRNEICRSIESLVAKRHNIAHGDYGETASKSDVTRYLKGVKVFCTRSDKQLVKRISKICGVNPWD